jgi:hypothetical protein
MKTMARLAEYDVNVWTSDRTVYVTFYPLEYLENGRATINTSKYYSLAIPGDARGPLYRQALAYLENLMNKDFDYLNQPYLSDGWTLEDDLDWWTTDTGVLYPPKLIADFVASLSRKGQ